MAAINTDNQDALSHEKLLTLLRYVKSTGKFIWRRTVASNVLAGSRAGRRHHSGYREVRVAGKLYREHRLAFFYVTGRWPELLIDHKNGVRDDNRWCNLREATLSQNMCNSDQNTGASGYRGIRVNHGKWEVTIKLNRKTYCLGAYSSLERAISVRQKAELKLHKAFARSARHKAAAENE